MCLRISHQALIYYCRSCAFPGKEFLSLSSVTPISLNIEQSLLFIYFTYIKDSVTVGLGLRDADKQKYDIAITLLHNVLVILNLNSSPGRCLTHYGSNECLFGIMPKPCLDLKTLTGT